PVWVKAGSVEASAFVVKRIACAEALEDRRVEGASDGLQRLIRIDSAERRPLAVPIHERLGVLDVRGQALTDDVDVIVGALDEAAAARRAVLRRVRPGVR